MLQWREDIPGGHPRSVRAWRGSARDASARVPPLLSTVFRWQVQTDRGWMEYEPVVADAITLAHNQGRPSVHVRVPLHTGGAGVGGRCVVIVIARLCSFSPRATCLEPLLIGPLEEIFSNGHGYR